MSEDIKETTNVDNSKIDQSSEARHAGVLHNDGAKAEPGGGLSGKRLAHYRLVEKLGGGGVAVVYRAIDEITDTPVAVKILLSGADEVMRERFRREAELASTLQHPHIVKTLDVGETAPDAAWVGPEDSIAYIVLELIEGYSLSQLLERHGRLSASDAAAILAPIAQALNFAHAHDIVHRDVKPSNILLRRETTQTPGSVRISALDYAVTPLLTDFGIARAMDAPELTSAGRTIGTPAFMSPEQCAGEERIDGRADVYGLGAVLYRCVVGKTPYQGSTTQMLYAHVYEPLLIPEEMVALLPPIALATLQRAMMKDPDQRYQSADEMALDLSLGAAPSGLSNGAEDGDALVTHTVTMPTLPVVRKEGQAEDATTAASRVLVPVTAPPPSTRPTFPPDRDGRLRQRPRTTVKLETAVPHARSRAAVAKSSRRELLRRRSWGAKLAMIAAAILLVVGGITTVSFILMERDFGFLPTITGNLDNNSNDSIVGAGPPPAGPLPSGSTSETPTTDSDADEEEASNESGSDTPTAPNTTATPPRALAGADLITADENDVDSDVVDAVDSPDDEGEDNAAIDEATSDTEATPTPPTVPLETAWEDANDLFVEEDWEAAREWLLMVRRVDPEFEAEQVRTMLETAYLELAQTAFDDDQLDTALQLLLEAADEQPDTETTVHLTQAYAAFQEDADNDAAVEDLRAALADVADALVEVDTPCRALLYGNVAVALGDTTDSIWLANLVEACNETQTPQLPTLAGRLIYSSQEGSAYSIFVMPVNAPNNSTLLVQNASQPKLRPEGGMIAFHNRQSSAPGLSGVDVQSSQSPSSRALNYTGELDDSRDSPPTWSPNGDRLAFSSTRRGDGRHRIYVTSADANHQAQELRTGKDPAWHPWQDLLVFNGVDDAGQNPGLWLMRSDGSDLRQLTDNGNDLRPAWTPDGNAIVFMSNGRHGHWELYRLDMDSLAVTRLTFSDAQDGLPAISPDGVYVAFASDRAGFWEFWYVPVYGGDSAQLGSMNGQLVSWLEHGLQWTR